jgi:hypothetical protein
MFIYFYSFKCNLIKASVIQYYKSKCMHYLKHSAFELDVVIGHLWKWMSSVTICKLYQSVIFTIVIIQKFKPIVVLILIRNIDTFEICWCIFALTLVTLCSKKYFSDFMYLCNTSMWHVYIMYSKHILQPASLPISRTAIP